MVNELKFIRTAAGRARPRSRTTFQAELTVMRNYGFVSKNGTAWVVGIPIDWEHVLEAMDDEL